MRVKEFYQDLLDMATPCEDNTVKCVFYNTCNYKEMACRDFVNWVENGDVENKIRLPRKNLYNELFTGDDNES